MQNEKLQLKIRNLRKKYPRFIYEDFSYDVIDNNLEIIFNFSISQSHENGSRDIKFRPKIVIENVEKVDLLRSDLNNLIFHLGLMEIPSYWKSVCSPTIEVRAGYLNSEQIKWWKKLFIDGMGQFYYENKIDWRNPNFLKIKIIHRSDLCKAIHRSDLCELELKDRYLVPFAGGRDSIVTLEALKKQKKEIALFTVNPIEKIRRAAKASGIKKQIIVQRIINKKLLELNKKGFLNGHTPFTGLLSFLAVLCAVIFDYKNIAFSNEKSAEEGNVKYLGKIINHQWAKSSEFEKMFKEYCKKYLVKSINYFSYLRKYGDLEISKIFSKYKRYFPVFSSCNAGMRINANGGLTAEERWCENCPKCLFVYLGLYPFLDEKQMLEIFSQDIFENRGLLGTMEGLLGRGKRKPFECVGTKKESRLAFEISYRKAKKSGKIPYLLTKFQN